MCGLDPSFSNKMIEMEKEKEICLNNETFRLIHGGKLEVGACAEVSDKCCITKNKDMKTQNQIQNIDQLDPKKIFMCSSIDSELDYCYVAGKASGLHCMSFAISKEFLGLLLERKKKVLSSSSSNETISFFPYSQINQSVVMEENSHPIKDPDIQCGILFLRHNRNKNKKQQQFKLSNFHYCNEDSCLTQLKTLHFSTTIQDLEGWRTKTDFISGVKVGGVTCKILHIYGASILLPMLLNLSFNIVVFINDFRKQKANLFEMITLFFLIYPQYKTIKLLAQYLFIHREDTLLNKQKEINDRMMGTMEPFLESSFQVEQLVINII